MRTLVLVAASVHSIQKGDIFLPRAPIAPPSRLAPHQLSDSFGPYGGMCAQLTCRRTGDIYSRPGPPSLPHPPSAPDWCILTSVLAASAYSMQTGDIWQLPVRVRFMSGGISGALLTYANLQVGKVGEGGAGALTG